MARSYGGILATIAFSIVMIRGVLHQEDLSATVGLALMAMMVFAGIGLVAGHIAQDTIKSSVQATITAEYQSQESTAESEEAVSS